MEEFLDAPFPAFRSQAPVHIPVVDIPILPGDGRFRGLVVPVQRVFEPVLQNPEEYLMPRYAPFEELPDDWEGFSGNNYIGVQQQLQEEWDAPEQVEDMDDEEETKHSSKPSSQDADAMSSASQHASKRHDSTTDESRLLTDIVSSSSSSSSSVCTFGPQELAMPDASLVAFGPTLDPVTSEVRKLNI